MSATEQTEAERVNEDRDSSAAGAAPIEPVQEAPTASGDWLDKGFESFGRAEWFAVFGAGNFAFRFGPFTGPEVGKIVERAVSEKIALTIVANCGAPVDWDLASQFKVADKPEDK